MLKKYFTYLYKNTSENSSKALYSMIRYDAGSRLLDCGCWDGINTAKYGDAAGAKGLFGLEIEQSKLKEALNAGIFAKKADLNKKFPFRNSQFDVVIANHVIEHLVNVRLFVSEIYRVLKKEGYVVIATPNLASWHNVFALILGMQPFSGPTIKPDYESDFEMVKSMNKKRMERVFKMQTSALDHVKVMTVKALIGLLKDSGFKVETVRGFGYYPLPPVLAGPLSKIDPYHSHYVVVKARK